MRDPTFMSSGSQTRNEEGWLPEVAGWVGLGGRQGEGELMFNGCRVSVLQDEAFEEVVEVDSGDGCTTVLSALNAAELVLKWLRDLLGDLSLLLPGQGMWVQSLVRELESHVPSGQKATS